MIQRFRGTVGETVHRLPIGYRQEVRGRGGPLPHHVPAGPPPLGWTDPAELVARAEERAREDAAAPVHDAVSLGHDALLLFESEIEHRRTEDARWIDQLAHADLMMADAIREGATVRATAADERVESLDDQIAEVDETVADSTAELRGDPPYEKSLWRAPERVAEPFLRTVVAVWGVVAVLLPAELGINMLALQFLGGDTFERFSFATVIGVAALWAGHAAGNWLAERRGAGMLARAGVPGALALLVLALTVLMAAFRVAYVERPQVDDLTGEPLPSTLTQAGVPALVVWAGIAAIQLIFFIVTVLHANRAHNPRVSARQWAQLRLRRLIRRRARSGLEAARAHAEVALAQAHRDEIEQMWAAKRAERYALFDQVVDRYLQELARMLANPDATVLLEARADGRRAEADRPPARRLTATSHRDTDPRPPGRAA